MAKRFLKIAHTNGKSTIDPNSGVGFQLDLKSENYKYEIKW